MNAPNGKQPRRHHQVAQGYLKGFATKKQRVRVVDRRGEMKPYTTHVLNVTTERDFYTIETAQGPSQTVETDLLQKIDSAAPPVIGKMIAGDFPPTIDDRASMAQFMAAQWLRGNDKRQAYQELEAKLEKFRVMNIPRATMREALREEDGREPSEAEIEGAVEYLSNPDNFEMVPHQNSAITLMLEMLPGVMNVLAHRTWRLMRSKGTALLTSDNPVVLHVTAEMARFGVGLATAEAITLPLDRHHVLVLTEGLEKDERKAAEQIYVMSDEQARSINWMTAANAHRWIIHHPDDDPLEGVTLLPPAGPRMRCDVPLQRMVPKGK